MAQPSPRKPTVLIVDDDSMMRETLKIILRSEEYPIAGDATNGQDAIAFCQDFKPGLVLLDINMPKMDGLQALDEIRKVSPESIVMMVSADATMGKVKEAIEKGAAGFVVKPLNPASVLDRIARCVRAKR